MKAARTGLALVGLSAGVPMFQGGDEMLRTQLGNNNAYNLDTAPMWLDWSLATTNAPFVAWTTELLAFRGAHAALRPAAFWDGTDHNGNGLPDIAFFDNTGAVASAAYLANTANHFPSWRIDGTEGGDTARSIWIAWNGWTAAISMPVPTPGSTTSWWDLGRQRGRDFPRGGARDGADGDDGQRGGEVGGGVRGAVAPAAKATSPDTRPAHPALPRSRRLCPLRVMTTGLACGAV